MRFRLVKGALNFLGQLVQDLTILEAKLGTRVQNIGRISHHYIGGLSILLYPRSEYLE